MRGPRSMMRAPSSGTSEEELARFADYRADPTIEKRNDIVGGYLDLAESIARRFARRGEPLDDLVQVASFGLIKSVERFDPAVGTSFVAFAIPTMVGEIKRHFRDRTWTMRVSRPTKDLIPRLRDTTETLTVELGRSPTLVELAQALDVGVDTVLEALEAKGAYRAMSLNSPSEHTGRAFDASLSTVDNGIVSVVDRLTVERLLSRLPARERRIVELRFFGEMTQSEIAAQVGISQMHVSRLLRRALERLDDLDGEVA